MKDLSKIEKYLFSWGLHSLNLEMIAIHTSVPSPAADEVGSRMDGGCSETKVGWDVTGDEVRAEAEAATGIEAEGVVASLTSDITSAEKQPTLKWNHATAPGSINNAMIIHFAKLEQETGMSVNKTIIFPVSGVVLRNMIYGVILLFTVID